VKKIKEKTDVHKTDPLGNTQTETSFF